MLWKRYKNSDWFSMRVGKKTRAALQPRALLTLHFYCLFISTNAELSVKIQSGRAAWHRERVWKTRRLNVAAPAVSLPEGNRQHVSVTTSELSNMVTTQLPSLTHPHSCWLFITVGSKFCYLGEMNSSNLTHMTSVVAASQSLLIKTKQRDALLVLGGAIRPEMNQRLFDYLFAMYSNQSVQSKT